MVEVWFTDLPKMWRSCRAFRLEFFLQPTRIHCIHRVILHIPVKIGIGLGGVCGGKHAGLRVVVAVMRCVLEFRAGIRVFAVGEVLAFVEL